MIRSTALTAATLLALTAAAQATPTIQRMRGTVESIADGTLTIETNDGKSAALTIGGDTKYVSVIKSSLDAIKDGVFIGTATKGENPPTALEVVLFPEAMRGTGEGHYNWDEIADTTAGGRTVKSAMTNGTVKASAARPLVKSAMTNGTVKSETSAGGGRTLTVTYSGGKSLEIAVPPSAPVVMFAPADKAAVKVGDKVFLGVAVDGDKRDVKQVAVGKDGLTPPM